MIAVLAGFLSRLTQVQKAVQGHDDTITAWQAEEGHGDVNMETFLMQECHGRQHRMCSMLLP